MTIYIQSVITNLAGVLSGMWLSLFKRASDAVPVIEPVIEAEPPAPKPAKIDDAPDNYTFHFKGALLDQLDVYFDVLKTMRTADPESFSLYSQIGAHLLPGHRFKDDSEQLSPWWRSNRPGFGAVACGVDTGTLDYEDKNEKLVPRFIYFTKYKSQFAPSEVQRTAIGLDVYVVTVYWEDRKRRGKKRLAAPMQFPVAVDPDGGVRILRTRCQERKTIVSKRGRDKGTFTIPQTKWGIQGFFKEWATENERPVEDFLRDIFVSTANKYELANQAMAKVLVSKGGVAGTFGIEPRRCAYFFKDRDVNLGETGARKKVFHIVRPHERRTRTKTTFVKMHFRGERTFVWNGYSVSVTVPGLHHVMVQEFDVVSIDGEHLDKVPEATWGMDTLGKRLRSHIEAADWKKKSA